MLAGLRAVIGGASLAALVSLNSAIGAAQAPQHVEVPREQWQRVADIFQALGVIPGAHVADIGAGGGFFTRRLAAAVGDAGRVYAVDVNPVSLRELREGPGTEFSNIEIVRGEEDNPHLPLNRLNGALIVNAYHEFAEFRTMLRHIRAALRPGGRLVLVEPIPRGDETTRRAQTKRHTIAIEFVEAEMKDAGFELVTKDVGFVTRPHHVSDAARKDAAVKGTDWLLVVRRPADAHN